MARGQRNAMEIDVKPVKKETLSQKIISEIKSLIDSGQLMPGTKLPSEREFCQMLGVSRPSLREALKSLSVLGIIEHRHGEGTYLTAEQDTWPIEPLSIFFSLKKGALIDVYEARMGLEKTTVELAARRRTQDDLENFKNILKKMRESIDDSTSFFKYDIKLHMAIVTSTRNPILIDLLQKIYKVHFETRNTLYSASETYEIDTRYDLSMHEELINHISDGNENAASENIHRHLLEVQERIKRATS